MSTEMFLVERPDGFIGAEVFVDGQLTVDELKELIDSLTVLHRGLLHKLKPVKCLMVRVNNCWWPAISYKGERSEQIAVRDDQSIRRYLMNELNVAVAVRPMTEDEIERYDVQIGELFDEWYQTSVKP